MMFFAIYNAVRLPRQIGLEPFNGLTSDHSVLCRIVSVRRRLLFSVIWPKFTKLQPFETKLRWKRHLANEYINNCIVCPLRTIEHVATEVWGPVGATAPNSWVMTCPQAFAIRTRDTSMFTLLVNVLFRTCTWRRKLLLAGRLELLPLIIWTLGSPCYKPPIFKPMFSLWRLTVLSDCTPMQPCEAWLCRFASRQLHQQCRDSKAWWQLLQELTKLLRKFLSIPVRRTVERSFSSSRRLKTFLRTTITQKRVTTETRCLVALSPRGYEKHAVSNAHRRLMEKLTKYHLSTKQWKLLIEYWPIME